MQEEPPKPGPEVDEPTPVEANTPDEKTSLIDKHKHHFHRFKNWYGSHKKWTIPGTILLLLIILAGIPFTRYNIAGLVLKKNFTVQVSDSTAHTPVSGATASIGGISATTDGSGKATLRGVKVGAKTLLINKKYYKNQSAKVVVGIFKEKTVPAVNLAATGRQVKIKVTNLITGKTLAGVDIKVADITAKTDSTGNALLVLPAGKTTQAGELSLDGYNDTKVAIQVSNSSIKENDFKITPAGKVYFISKATGQLNVMKTNLDGSNPQVVVAATGFEQDSDTALLQSGDGKYVALVAKRTATDPTAQLYVLATADDKLLQADNGNAVFNIYGWANDTLIYTVQRQDLPSWQQGVGKIKAYDATSGTTTLLDQTGGSDAATNINEVYNNVVISGNQVVYSKYWGGDQAVMTGKQNTVQIIDADGQNHKVVASYDATSSIQQLVPHSPTSFYIYVLQDSTDTQYFDYTIGSTPKSVSISDEQLYQNDFSYFFSPSGNQTFWSETRDGKNTLLVGDGSGANPATVASLSDYNAYGWYGDQYLILSKNGSELDVMSAKGGAAIKISNYENTGYGFGYGGR